MTTQKPPAKQLAKPGWEQFLVGKQSMLYEYRMAKVHSKAAQVRTFHGTAAEACFRKWLSEFLPRRFAVTSGYILPQIPHGGAEATRGPHYDVIIYDCLNAPVLWAETTHDRSAGGASRAIPAEYVYGVIEVKSRLSIKTARDALAHLEKLRPMLLDVDRPQDRFRRYLPERFFSEIVFFELPTKEASSKACLDELVPREPLRGYFGGAVLRAWRRSIDQTGYIRWIEAKNPPLPYYARESEMSLLDGCHLSVATQASQGRDYALMLKWGPNAFAMFAFDILAMLEDRYMLGVISSHHGLR